MMAPIACRTDLLASRMGKSVAEVSGAKSLNQRLCACRHAPPELGRLVDPRDSREPRRRDVDQAGLAFGGTDEIV